MTLNPNGVRDAESVGRLGTVLGVWAHPDDETYCAAGVMAAARRAGNRVVCVTATRGERGARGHERPAEEVASQRSAELERALALLGVDEHVFLGYPDGGCDAVDASGPVARLRRVIADVQPATVLTFGPDGLTGHGDHMAVGRWAVGAARGTDAAVHAVTRTPGWVDEFLVVLAATGMFRRSAPTPTPVDQLSIHLELTGELLLSKEAAVGCHHSQVTTVRTALGDDAFRRTLAEEAFRVLPSPHRP